MAKADYKLPLELDDVGCITDATGRQIAAVSDRNWKERPNAHFVFHAINAHDALVEACRQALRMCQIDWLEAQLDAALALADGKTPTTGDRT